MGTTHRRLAFEMAMEKSTSRVAMGLLCGLAICCAVMYITADGADVQETILAPAKSVYGIGGPSSVDSEDVEKVGTVFTNTPDGRMRLTDYLTNVEKEIASEEAARKRDVAAVRAQMARNFAFNKAARSKLKKALLHKMAVNAKKAKDDLDTGMRYVQGKFASMAKLQNERNKANIARSKYIRGVVEANKREAKKNLQAQVLTQQRAMAALASAVNARIAKTNKHVAINAAQIKENAKKAREELDAAVAIFDKKAANARAEAAAGRSKLAAQLAAQDKSIRQWANNKLKVVMAKTAAQFRRVREKMAEDRHNADMALKSASSRMTAALSANSALNDKRFSQTVADIAAAKKEAEERVEEAEASFKTSIYVLTSTVNEQVMKTNNRIDQLSDTVEKHKVARAKINANVNAEMKRMVDLGNKRYSEHLKKDEELKSLIDSNKAATDKRMEAMAAHYTIELSAVRATMKKNRAHATHMLAKESAALYGAIMEMEEEQMKTNEELASQTARARLDVEDSLRSAKEDFAELLGALHKNVVDNDKKFEGKMDKLTGIVRANAVKSAKGREELAAIMEANKKELTAAVRDAVTKGEQQMQAAEEHLENLNEKTKAALNVKITTEISKLTKDANSQIEGLRLNSKEARDMMKKELLYAVRAMAEESKKNLDDAVASATETFNDVNAKEKAAADASAADRAAIAEQIAIEKSNAEGSLSAAVATMTKSLLALKHETATAIEKTNTRVDAYAQQLKKQAEETKLMMKEQMTVLTGKIEAQKESASADIAAADAASASAFGEVMDKVAADLAAAQAKAESKFGDLTEAMADQRAELDENLAKSVTEINDSIAKQAALADSRFSKTVKDIGAARKEAQDQVRQARKDFATGLLSVTDQIKAMDTKLVNQVQVVSAEVISHKAAQTRVNQHVAAEIKRVEKLMNDQNSKSIKARGKLRAILDENKRAAHDEVVALDGLFKEKIAEISAQANADALGAKKDLTEATEKMYEQMAEVQKANLYANEEHATAIDAYSKDSLGAIADSKAWFTDRMDILTDTIAANHKKVEKNFEILTGVVRSYKEAGEADRDLIRMQNDALNAEMMEAIDTAIQIGEAKAKAVAQRARAALKGTSDALLVEITDTVEEYADATFKLVQGNHQKIADNYLSFKAYAVTASEKITEYVAKGKGKNLSSLGDLLVNTAFLSDVTVEPEEGLSPTKEIPLPFSNGKVEIDNSVSKINGLVNEYVKTVNSCRERWPMGLGKYLLMKLEGAMTKKGVLQVDKLESKSGNWVFMNGHAVGLSNKLNDFEGLAVRMGTYEATLAKLTATLSGKPKDTAAAEVYVPPPEWEGK